VLSVPRYVDLTLHDYEEFLTAFPLAAQNFARFEVDILGQLGKFSQLLAREAFK
jgi:hypothetical protein